MGAVERLMMEYSFVIADGTISSIAKPTVQPNNFEIKLSIIQIIWSSVQFFGLPDEDYNKHLANFLQICDIFKFNSVRDDVVRLRFFYSHYVILPRIGFSPYLSILDTESLYDAWGRFKNILRKCPHHELPVCRQERTNKRVASIHGVDAITAFSAQMATLTQVDNLGVALRNDLPIKSCGACGHMGHLSQNCKVGSQLAIHKDANFISHGGRSNFNPYANTYNPRWHSHPNFSRSNNQQQGPRGYHQPQQQQQAPQAKKSNLKDMFSNFITTANTQLQNQDASIQNLEVQVGQLVSIVPRRNQGQVPSDTEKNSREQVNAIIVRNERAIEKESPEE
ncbi:UNVERIFIED_CONTAM: hypothetical protein Slati_4428100 [Sesamum latifolium]|uniref:CCHC-type domain-containing protein n=1 Tax=Sesamum latifolium TaxID=2727402 RepID=A0AAW2SQB3_9LAMI